MTLTCEQCPNFPRNKIVPSKYTRTKENLCLPCYNIMQFQYGEPYLCGSCCMTQLRMKTPTHCYSCAEVDESKIIPLIDYKNQSVKHQLNEQLKNKTYVDNFHIVSEYYDFKNPQCEVFMSDIPKELIEYCQSGKLTKEEIYNYINIST